ncbi:MAG: Gfo/Idh/MocA family oxidoreductase [Bacteroidales bacterium]|nr:Gfo/Idh/MocA family oxidoreductase [Bacteroidales bacterium]
MTNKTDLISRRKFLGTSAIAAAGITVLPSSVIAGLGHRAPSDKLNIAAVGIGGMGHSNINAVKGSENIVALCDVDWSYAEGTFSEHPRAKYYKDWRKMYDEMAKSIDAVIVATADHTHAIIAATGITLGKHVYVQKPLTHSVYESRLLTKLAAKYGVATQMGNQGSSGNGVNKTCEWLAAGVIGDVTKVEAFTDRPIWPQGLNTPENKETVPQTLDWDLFSGPAEVVPYNSIYHPWNWRGWWRYGTGALGDMACHILHPVFVGLDLGYPTKVQGSSSLLLNDCAPVSQFVSLTFPARQPKTVKGRTMKMKLPEVEVTWSDGGIKPLMPKGWPAGREPNDSGGYVCFHGTKDKLICGCYGVNPWLLSDPERKKEPKVPEFRRRITTSHEMDWVAACKEPVESRRKLASSFDEAGPFNEMVVMGVLAVRLQSLNKILEWDGENMQFTNLTDDETIKICKKDGFSIHNGHPTFKKDWTDPIPAKQLAAELIKHTYRKGWTLPEMPA